MGKQIFYSLILLTLVACAPMEPPNETTQLSSLKSDFASGVSAVVDYVSDSRRTFIVVDIENPRGDFIHCWLVQKNTTQGQWTASGKQFYAGTSKLETKTFRVPLSEAGISETFVVEVFDESGGLLMMTEPITNTFQTEGTP